MILMEDGTKIDLKDFKPSEEAEAVFEEIAYRGLLDFFQAIFEEDVKTSLPEGLSEGYINTFLWIYAPRIIKGLEDDGTLQMSYPY